MLRESPGALPGALAMVVFGVWAARDGGFDPLRWLPGTLFLLALLVISVLAARRISLPRAAALALAALAGFTVWSYLSITWAGVPANAWLGANRTFLYLCVFALFVMFPWRTHAAALLTGGFAVGVAVIGLVTLVRVSIADAPVDWFIGGRLAAPITYSNADTGLYLTSFFPALYLAARREVHPLLRGVLLASAGVLVELALLGQSRASLFAFPLTLVVYFLIVPGRLRALIPLTLAGVATLASANAVLDIYGPAVSGGAVDVAAVEARSAVIWSAAALFVAGAVVGLVDRRVHIGPSVVRTARVVAACAVLLAVVGASVAALERYGDPVEQVDVWLDEFRNGQEVYAPDVPHLSSGFGGGRYDIWRVAWNLFVDNPTRGVGVDNFHVEYVRQRRSLNDSAYPHSLELRVLSQTGVVGGALFLAFLAAAVSGFVASLRRGPALSRGLAGAAFGGFLYWFVHGSVDWFWEMPALAAPAFALLGISMRLGESAPAGTPPRLPRAVLAVPSGAVAIVVGVSLALPWLAARDIDEALRGWRNDPAAALDRLDRARSLDPLTDQADIFAALIAAEVGDRPQQRAALDRALERNPHNWYPYLELGVLEMHAGRQKAALRRLAHARRLNRFEPALIVVEQWLEEGRRPTRDDLDKLLLSRAAHLESGAQ